MREPSGKPKQGSVDKVDAEAYPPDEAARRAEASLKRLLRTPPKPQRKSRITGPTTAKKPH